VLYIVEDILSSLEAVTGRKHPSTVQVKQLKTYLPLMPVLRHFVTSPVNCTALFSSSGSGVTMHLSDSFVDVTRDGSVLKAFGKKTYDQRMPFTLVTGGDENKLAQS